MAKTNLLIYTLTLEQPFYSQVLVLVGQATRTTHMHIAHTLSCCYFLGLIVTGQRLKELRGWALRTAFDG